MARILFLLVAALLLISQASRTSDLSLDGEPPGGLQRQKRSENDCGRTGTLVPCRASASAALQQPRCFSEAGKTLRATVMRMLRGAVEWVASLLRGPTPDRPRADAEEMEPDADWELSA